MRASVMPHYNYAKYIVEHGTIDEKKNCRQTLETMDLLLKTFDGGWFEPMDSIILIDQLVAFADTLTEKRWNDAHRMHYGDHQGKIGRTKDEERQTVRAHLAAQMMLGLPLGKPDTFAEARIVGNIGEYNEAFVPIHNPIQHHLIVDPSTDEQIVSWLVVPEGERTFRLAGWMTAEEAHQPAYIRRREREGGASVAYWVPPKDLHPVREWWAWKHE
jgi:hypothetical protein